MTTMTPPMADVVERLWKLAEYNGTGANSIIRDGLREAVAEIETLRARLPQAGAGGGVVVKPLIWNGAIAETPFCVYLVAEVGPADKEEWEWSRSEYPYADRSDEKYATETEAKAAAQADYEARVLAALAPSPSVGAYKSTSDAAWEENVRLLSGAPAPVQPTASVEAVRAALDCAQWLEVILAETGWKEPEGEQHLAASIDRARSLTAPTQGAGPRVIRKESPPFVFDDDEPTPSSPVSEAGGEP